MNGFERRALRIKENIMKTALEMMRTTELKKIRIADVSKAANVSQVTIYNYFGSKEALLRQTFIHYVEESIRDFEVFMNEEHSFREKLEHILLLKNDSMRTFPPRLIQELLSEDPELSVYIDKQYKEKTVPLTIRFLQEGKDRGDISEDVSIENVLAFMQLYMNQYETMLGIARQSGDMGGFMNGMVHMFFYGICGKT
jgi:AcrR family transcriptional regulator